MVQIYAHYSTKDEFFLHTEGYQKKVRKDARLLLE